jgi:nucleotide-binding universal stress UspA family protein
MKGETILVPLDGSLASEAVLPYANEIAKAIGAGLRLLTVVEPEPRTALLPHLGFDLAHRLQSEAGQYLSQTAAKLQAQGINAMVASSAGNPSAEILRAAEEPDIAIIAMATHGRGGFERWSLGSVADKVMRMSSKPTLLVRPPEDGQTVGLTALRRLLVPLDGSAMAEAAIAPAARLAQATGAKLQLVRVEPWLSTTAAYAMDGVYVPDLSTLEDEARQAAQEYLDTASLQVPSGVECQSVVLRGLVNMLLEPYIKENIDLVVMSTHGRGGLARFVIGSNADNLVRAGVPALLIKPREMLTADTRTMESAVAAS